MVVHAVAYAVEQWGQAGNFPLAYCAGWLVIMCCKFGRCVTCGSIEACGSKLIVQRIMGLVQAAEHSAASKLGALDWPFEFSTGKAVAGLHLRLAKLQLAQQNQDKMKKLLILVVRQVAFMAVAAFHMVTCRTWVVDRCGLRLQVWSAKQQWF